MKILSCIFFLSVTITVIAQDHLEPEKDRAKYEGILKEYYPSLFQKLLANMSDKPIARYLVIPSFSPEYVVSLENEGNEKYVLKYCVVEKSFWHAKDKSNVKALNKKTVISAQLATTIRELFETAISQAKIPERKEIRSDGVDYLFSFYDVNKGIITGEKWSPDKNTKMAELVSLCEKYKSLVNNKGGDRDKLIDETLSLIAKLKSCDMNH